jgi:diguanylate cyclase (GGDEF)-like protein
MFWPSLRRLISPVVILIIAISLRQYSVELESAYIQLLQFTPYALLIVVSALCIHYNRSRLFVSTLSLFIIYYFVQTRLQTALTHQDTLMVYSLISVMHPLSLLILLFLPERGLMNQYGIYLLGTVLLAVFSAGLLIDYSEASLILFISKWLEVKPFSGLILSLSASFCYLLALIAGIYRLVKRNDDFAVISITILLFTFVALACLNMPNISAVMFSMCSASLIVSMLGTSYDMAYRDELTGLLGRRALNDRMKGLGRQYVIAMMDVDHFKNFNDTHGHDIGDEVLKMVARQIDAVKGGGTAYRYGGEEFCVVYAGKDNDYCEPFLEQVRQNIENYRMTIRNEAQRPKTKSKAQQRRGRRTKNRKEASVSVTISIGIAESTGKQGKPEVVLKAADKALYKAKNKGRNCIAY